MENGIEIACPKKAQLLVTYFNMSLEHKTTFGDLASLADYINNAIEEGKLDASDGITIDAVKEVIAEDNLHEDYKQSVVDAWKQEMYVESKDGKFTVGSIGQDGQKGTADDIILDAKGAIVQGEMTEETSAWFYVQITFVVFLVIAVAVWLIQKRGQS